MGLLTKLKSLLGLEDDRSQVRRTESGVTIEREPDESAEPNVEAESAVKGVDTGTEESADGSKSDTPDVEDAKSDDPEDDAAETGISTEDVTTAPEGSESVETGRDSAAEPAEAVQPSTDAAHPDQSAGDEPEPTPEDTADEDAESDTAEEPVGEGEPLEDVKGIGPAYAERLRDAGVADMTELATADAEQLAEETGLSDKRISTWIERAQAR